MLHTMFNLPKIKSDTLYMHNVNIYFHVFFPKSLLDFPAEIKQSLKQTAECKLTRLFINFLQTENGGIHKSLNILNPIPAGGGGSI